MATQPGEERSTSSSAAKPNTSTDSSVERKTFGKYQIVRKIGAGGMGVVYLARDTQLGRTVALKVLSKDKKENPILVKRFQSEARAAAQLKHNNIVVVYEASEIEGYPYIALEYVDGTDVHNLVAKRGPLPVRRSIEIVKQVARALDHAHQKGIVHRDIKPSNLLLSRDGTVKLTDMGLARSLDESMESGITRDGTTVGTVDYMAPEQARDSKSADVRSDIYSLGCTWYHMLTGSPPFPSGDLISKLFAHSAKERPDPRELNKTVPIGVVMVMHRMLERKPKDRYQTPAELLDALEHIDSISDTAAPQYLAALSEAVGDDAPDDVGAPAATAAPQRPPVMPPRRRQAPVKPAASGGLDPAIVKYAGIAAATLSLLGLLWWIAVQFASGLDRPQATGNPFVSDAVTAPETATAPEATAPQPEKATRTKKSVPPEEKEEKAETPVTVVNSPQATNTLSIIKLSAPGDGAGNHALGRRGEREYVPAWASAEWGLAEPNDIDPSLHSKMRVGRGQGGPAQFAELQDALENLPERGGIIELAGEGPFYIAPIELQGKQVVITAAEEARPLVVFLPQESSETVLAVSNGSIAFHRVHLAALASEFEESDVQPPLVEVDSGDLAVRDCSVTLVGKFSGRVTAFRVTGAIPEPGRAPADQSNILLDGVVARGSELCVLEIDQPATDLLAHNCLFATGSQPAVRLTNNVPMTTAVAETRRRLQFLSCTLVARTAALDFQPGVTVANPPPTAVLTLNSVFAAAPGASDATLLNIGAWPVTGSVSAPVSQGLSWETASSLFAGWADYVRGDKLVVARIQSASAWQQFWNRAADASDQFRADLHWPAAPISEWSGVMPRTLERPAAETGGVVATDGGNPGCDVAALSVPVTALYERATVFVNRPRPPLDLLSGAQATRTEEVDGTRVDLGELLSKGDWPSGTRFIVSGSGRRESSPIRVAGKTLYLQFEQAQGPPLKIVPRKSADASREPFVKVTGGTLVIEGGQFEISAPTRQPPPVSRFLEVIDGSFALRNTTIEANRAGEQFEGLIAWRRQAAPSPSDETPEEFALIENSYLAGPGTLLDFDIRGRAARVENSVLCGVNTLFGISIKSADPTIAGAIDITESTLSASERFFNVQSELTGAATDPLEIVIERTVFAPPVSTGGDGPPQPVVVDCPEAVRAAKAIAWWEAENGYAREVNRLFPDSTPSFSKSELVQQWESAWGPAHVQRPLFGEVLLVSSLPTFSQVTRDNFVLHRPSEPATWGTTGESIGAPFESDQSVESAARDRPKKQAAEAKPSGRKTRRSTGF